MSQDIVADTLNQIMNAKRVEKKELTVKRKSKLLLNLLGLMKSKGYIDYIEDADGRSVHIKIIKLNQCRAVKPRYIVSSENIETYLRRFLPSRKFGELIVSTNKGLLDHKQVIETNVGGAAIAYFY
jgi:small subunit ribosomal protein S8